MATPIDTTIINECHNRLSNNITTANGYSCTVAKCEKARLKPFKPFHLPAVNIWCTTSNSSDGQYNLDSRTLSIYVEIHSITRETPFIELAAELAADVVTALSRKTTAPKVSDDSDLNLNDIVDDLNYDGYDYEIGEGQAPWCAALVRLTANYSTEKNNMYS